MIHSFLNDYGDGGHPSILEALTNDSFEQQAGYGLDEVSNNVRELLIREMHFDSAEIHFVAGGTLANLVCLAAMLKPYEAVIAPSSGHIANNEAGAIEATGHKIITLPVSDGKLTPLDIDHTINHLSSRPYMVRAKAVYISNATELGTIYSKAELTALSQTCRKQNLYLFVDGARLGMALASSENDLELADIARLVDVFWLGGTKMGAMYGEAIVITNKALQTDFSLHLKQRGALLAKSRILGVQFKILLEDRLFLQLARHANNMAHKIATCFVNEGYELISAPQTNQIFVILPDSCVNFLKKSFDFYEWEKRPYGNTLIRIVTSWATKERIVDEFIMQIKSAPSSTDV